MRSDTSQYPRLFFLHIPKAAGTTFYQILYRHYPYKVIAKINGTYIEQSIEEIVNWPESKKDTMQVIMKQVPTHFMLIIRIELIQQEIKPNRYYMAQWQQPQLIRHLQLMLL